MRWRWWRRRAELHGPDDVRTLHEAKKTLRDAQNRDPQVRAVVEETRRRQVDNHMGQLFYDAFYLGRRRHP